MSVMAIQLRAAMPLWEKCAQGVLHVVTCSVLRGHPLVAPLGATSLPLLSWLWRRDGVGLSKPLLLLILFVILSCLARALFVLGVVGKGSPPSPGKKK